MNFAKMGAVVAVAAAAVFGGSAMAATISNEDGALSPFSGFDWASGGAAWTTGLTAAETALAGGCVASCSFTINYASWAQALTMPSSGALNSPGLDSNPNGGGAGYEYTIKSTLTATLVAYIPGVTAVYSITGGAFDIYYDTSANANLNDGGTGVWTGFDDGINIISGTLSTLNPQLFNLFDGSGSLSLVGEVTGQNSTYVSPEIIGTRVVSTLQLFPSPQITDFTPPVSVDGVVLPAVGPADPEALFQADSNQNFDFKVPEPGSMLLAGLALTGLGFASRRRKI